MNIFPVSFPSKPPFYGLGCLWIDNDRLVDNVYVGLGCSWIDNDRLVDNVV